MVLAGFYRGLTPRPSLFPDWPEGAVGSLPKLRDLTWEPPKIRPALYLRTGPDRSPSTHLILRCDVLYLRRQSVGLRAVQTGGHASEPVPGFDYRHLTSRVKERSLPAWEGCWTD